MRDPMADITNPGATRDTGAARHVRSGMELLAWRYPQDEWQRHRNARSRRRWLAGLSQTRQNKPGEGPRRHRSSAATKVLGGLFGVGLLAGAFAESAIVMGAFGVGLVGTLAAHLATRRRHQPIDIKDAPEVLFTSTGVIFGDHARRWRGHRYRLDAARVRFGELTQLEPAYLELDFSTGWSETTLCIPVPSALERDAVELAARLEDMMLGRSLEPRPRGPLTTGEIEDRDENA